MAALVADWLYPKDRQDFGMEIGGDWTQSWKVTVGKSALPLDTASIEVRVKTRGELISYTTSNGDLTIQGATVILNAAGTP